MQQGEYKEVDFPPMPVQNKKSTIIVGPIKECTPSPVDLCTTQHLASENLKPEKKRKFVAGTILHSPFDDIRHMKHRITQDTCITPAHQSDSTSVGTCAFMSTSSAVVGLSATATPVHNLSMKRSSGLFSGSSSYTTPKLGGNYFSLASKPAMQSFGTFGAQQKDSFSICETSKSGFLKRKINATGIASHESAMYGKI